MTDECPLCYLPIPPRAWSRAASMCLTPETAMKQKGNVLQYRAQSALFTRNQRYSQIARGKWTKQRTSWATQGNQFTNPNTASMRRANATNAAIDPRTGELIGPTLLPISCPIAPVFPAYAELPMSGDPGPTDEVLPPAPGPPAGEGNVIPTVPAAPDLEPIVIPDGGSLVCGTYEDVCTGESSTRPTGKRCYPTTDSDVPGSITELCWNDGNTTWIPRQNLERDDTGTKWPVNATLVSAVHDCDDL
jgi:hypothetical protein